MINRLLHWLAYPPFFAWPWTLRRHKVLGMNERNMRLIARNNPRRLYPFADNKVITKARAAEEGIPTPELYKVIKYIAELKELENIVAKYKDFVLKPARGSGGNGVLVVQRKEDGKLETVSGKPLTIDDLKQHGAKILHGLFSLGGRPDQLMVEYRVKFSKELAHLTYQGVPDFRIIVHKGIPIMAMGRLPTSQSQGRANLHQGAVGVGIDVETGLTKGGVHKGKLVDKHPDTGADLNNVLIPYWPKIREIASSCSKIAKLGYLGADIVLDEDLGPLLLEINVRPGLAIQLANQTGLKDCILPD